MENRASSLPRKFIFAGISSIRYPSTNSLNCFNPTAICARNHKGNLLFFSPHGNFHIPRVQLKAPELLQYPHSDISSLKQTEFL